jgi:diguanylate cyclase (GGDEF)-like protein/PAS domain S-box-containing protein
MKNDVFFKGLVDNLPEGVYFLDQNRRITFWSRGAERLTGYPAAEVLGLCCADGLLQHMDEKGRILCGAGCPMEATARDGQEKALELFLRHKKGHRVAVTVRAIPIRGHLGEIVGAVEVFNDVSGHALTAGRVRELESLSLIDPVTGAGNRSHAESQIALRLAEKKRGGHSFGLLFLEVAEMKSAKDGHGRAAGDETLGIVGRNLAGALQPGDFLGRWGAEEFVVLTQGLEGPLLAEAARRLRELVRRCRVPSVPSLQITVSIGVTEARSDDSVTSIVSRADALRREARKRGRDLIMDDVCGVPAAEA